MTKWWFSVLTGAFEPWDRVRVFSSFGVDVVKLVRLSCAATLFWGMSENNFKKLRDQVSLKAACEFLYVPRWFRSLRQPPQASSAACTRPCIDLLSSDVDPTIYNFDFPQQQPYITVRGAVFFSLFVILWWRFEDLDSTEEVSADSSVAPNTAGASDYQSTHVHLPCTGTSENHWSGLTEGFKCHICQWLVFIASGDAIFGVTRRLAQTSSTTDLMSR